MNDQIAAAKPIPGNLASNDDQVAMQNVLDHSSNSNPENSSPSDQHVEGSVPLDKELKRDDEVTMVGPDGKEGRYIIVDPGPRNAEGDYDNAKVKPAPPPGGSTGNICPVS